MYSVPKANKNVCFRAVDVLAAREIKQRMKHFKTSVENYFIYKIEICHKVTFKICNDEHNIETHF